MLSTCQVKEGAEGGGGQASPRHRHLLRHPGADSAGSFCGEHDSKGHPKGILFRPRHPSGRRSAAGDRPVAAASTPAWLGLAWPEGNGRANRHRHRGSPGTGARQDRGGERRGEGREAASPPLSLTFRWREAAGRSGSAMTAPAHREPRAAGGAVAWRPAGDAAGGRGRARRSRSGPARPGSAAGSGSPGPQRLGSARPAPPGPAAGSLRVIARPGGTGGRRALAFLLRSPGGAGPEAAG